MTAARFDINQFRTDDSLSKAGVWVDFGASAEFKIASFGNEDFGVEFRRRTDPWTKMGVEVPDDEQETIMVELLAKYIVLDWKGVFEGEDELPYSRENAERLLREVPFVRSRIIEEARRIQNFRATEAKAVEKN